MEIKKNQIFLNEDIKTKKELFSFISRKSEEANLVASKKRLEEGLWERENVGQTGMEKEFAIPHAKIKEIKKASIIVIKLKDYITDYKTFDGTKVKYVVSLLIPDSENSVHIKLLSQVALSLNDNDFSNKLKKSKTKEEIVNLFKTVTLKKEKKPKNEKKMSIVGITSCAAGIAHTYISAEKLIKEGLNMGYNVKIETQGASGHENILTSEEIKEAELVIIASDINVELDRFNNKKIYRTKVSNAVKNPKEVINNAFRNSKIYKAEGNLNNKSFEDTTKRSVLSHIMNGISWMIPLLVAAAIMLAIPNIAGMFVGKTDIVSQGNWKDYQSNGLGSAFWKFMLMMMKMGWASIGLMFPIFGAFTAFSIGKKPAFIPGLIGGFLSNPSMIFQGAVDLFEPNKYPFLDKTSGFWGALIIGLLIGYIIKIANSKIKVNKVAASIKPMLIIPFIGIVIVILTMVLAINPAFGLLNEQLTKLGKISGKSGKYVLALVIAPMTASDMGGPINKAAYATMYGFYHSHVFSQMIRVIPTVTPSFGLGLAALLDRFIVKRRVFDDDVRPVAPNCIILGLLGIGEGGLPFLFKRPLLTIPINMVGGLLGSFIGIMTQTEQWFPDSAIWAWPFAKPVWGLLLAILVGTAATMFMHIFIRIFLIKIGKLKINAEPIKPIDWKKIKKSFRIKK